MLVSSTILLLNNLRINENFKSIVSLKTETIISNNAYIISYLTILLLFTAIPAVLVAVNCNPENPVFYGLIALIFSDLYLLQWSIKKFVFKFDKYCKL